jgi:hypothetical protein
MSAGLSPMCPESRVEFPALGRSRCWNRPRMLAALETGYSISVASGFSRTLANVTGGRLGRGRRAAAE